MNDDLTTLLSRQLHDQVDDMRDTPLTLDGVRGRARSIRRTRRVVASAAVAAVFAIAAPVAVLAGGGLDAGPDRTVPPATTTPSKGVDTANPEPEGSGLGVPYLQGTTLTMPDGTERTLPRDYDSAAVLGDRVLAVRVDTDNGQATLDRVEDGEVVSSEALASFALAPNGDGTAVAYVRADAQLVIESADGQMGIGSYGQAQPVRLLGGPDCVTEPADCRVLLDTGRAPLLVTGSGETVALPDEAMGAEDASAAVDRVAVLTSIDELEPGSCSTVAGLSGPARTVFETCDFTPDRFSPDGSYLSAGPDYRDGIGDNLVAILDGESGEELARFEPQNGYVNSFVWEDAEHLLAVTYSWDGGQWSVVRIGADDSTETVLGPESGGEMKPPWRLLGAS